MLWTNTRNDERGESLVGRFGNEVIFPACPFLVGEGFEGSTAAFSRFLISLIISFGGVVAVFGPKKGQFEIFNLNFEIGENRCLFGWGIFGACLRRQGIRGLNFKKLNGGEGKPNFGDGGGAVSVANRLKGGVRSTN